MYLVVLISPLIGLSVWAGMYLLCHVGTYIISTISANDEIYFSSKSMLEYVSIYSENKQGLILHTVG